MKSTAIFLSLCLLLMGCRPAENVDADLLVSGIYELTYSSGPKLIRIECRGNAIAAYSDTLSSGGVYNTSALVTAEYCGRLRQRVQFAFYHPLIREYGYTHSDNHTFTIFTPLDTVWLQAVCGQPGKYYGEAVVRAVTSFRQVPPFPSPITEYRTHKYTLQFVHP